MDAEAGSDQDEMYAPARGGGHNNNSSEAGGAGRMKIQRKRKHKDPNAPTRPRSAYLLFLLAKNQEIRSQDGFDSKGAGSVVEVTRQVGAAWQNISEADRTYYQERAEEDKKRYDEEMKVYEQSEAARRFRAQAFKQSPSSHTSAGHRQKIRQRSVSSTSSIPNQHGRRRGPKPHKRNSSGSPEITAPKKHRGNNVPVHPFLMQASMLANSGDRLAELKVPIFNDDFIEWNTRREKELRRIRHLAHELEIDVAGLQSHSDQVSRFAEEAAEASQKLEQIRAARIEISNILLEEFDDYSLPNGLTMDEDNVEYFMAQVECYAHGKHSSVSQQLQQKLRQLAPRLEQFMVLLQ